VANCSYCSAPLPDNGIKCAYCGSINDIDLAEINYHTTEEIESARTCPRCSVPMRTIDLQLNGKFLIERCEQCLGLFFDPNELDALLEAKVTNVFSVNRALLDNISNSRRSSDYGVSYVKCPVCSNMMNRVNFGAKSGVIVDSCKDHGVWLDGGELRQLFEWTKAGGRILDREKREQLRLDEAKEKERLDRQRQSVLTESGYNNNDSSGSSWGAGDLDLVDVVCGALKSLLR
jgi:Zn-finger nucleic acid-binding protein